MIGMLFLGLASAQSTADLLTVRVAIDDRGPKRLAAASLRVEGGPSTFFYDNGGTPGDVPGDGVYLATVQVPRAAKLRVHVLDGKTDLGAFEIRPSAESRADLALKTTHGTPELIVDVNAPAIPDAVATPVVPAPAGPAPVPTPLVATPAGPAPTVTPTPEANAPLVAQAAPTSVETTAAGASDHIRLQILVDDREAARIHAGTLVAQQEGLGPVVLKDDGTAPDKKANDSLYAAVLLLARAEFAKVTVVDEPGGPVGEVTVFLPSASEATVRLRTLAAAPGLELATEPTAAGDVTAPTATAPGSAGGGGGSGGGGGGGGGAVSRDRLSQILWVFVSVFAVAFTWARSVVARRWVTEVQPVLQRLDRWLAAHEAADRPPPEEGP